VEVARDVACRRGRLCAEGRVLGLGRRAAFAEAELEQFVHRDQVAVMHRGDEPELVAKLPARTVADPDQVLERDGPAKRVVVGAVHRAEAAATEQPVDPEALRDAWTMQPPPPHHGTA
jgi:hypothetical protein